MTRMEYYRRLKDDMGLIFVSPAQNGNVKMSSLDGQSFVYVPDPHGMFESARQIAYDILMENGPMAAY